MTLVKIIMCCSITLPSRCRVWGLGHAPPPKPQTQMPRLESLHQAVHAARRDQACGCGGCGFGVTVRVGARG
ncbi:hypothetical protein T484DRAFT_1989845 [Baffinella frigidus]|nr:hypothetical protein T484DRAFT_1989845 [Cryptophyta sp. CCMP2293]